MGTARIGLLALVLSIVLASLALAQNDDVPRVRVEPPTVGPAYAPEIVRRVVRRHRAGIVACLAGTRAIARALDLTIAPDGRVTSASIEMQPSDAAARRCAEHEMLSWRFPTPPGGGAMHVRYPIVDGRL